MTEDEAPVAGWQAIYCSLVLILVAFFAMLCSYSSVEGQKMIDFMRSMGETADLPTFGVPPDLRMRHIEGAGMSPDEGNSHSPDVVGSEEKSLTVAMASLEKLAREMDLGDKVEIEETKRGFKATVSSGVFFPSGAAEVSKEAYPYLDEMVRVAKKEADLFIKVEGHTDNVPVNTPEFPSNWELSTARAVNVLRYFLGVGNIPAKRLVAVGYGQYHPIASNNTQEGRSRNRRVEFFFERPG